MGNKGETDYTFLVKGKEGEFNIKNERSRGYLKARLIFGLLFFFFISLGAESYAQSTAIRKRTVENKDSIMPFNSRWALRTNAVDWVMLLPNITAEFDLFGSPYKHYTLSLGIRGNWKTNQTYKPYMVYNLLNGNIEFRQYFRTSQRYYVRPDSVKVNVFKRMKEDVFTIKRLHPRYWRAYYWGIYADAADYTLKFGKTGYQGTAIGLGLSGGFSVPLYGYRDNFVDLELGASIGAVYTKYDKFERDKESNSYVTLPNQSKGGHLVPFPVVRELRVAFVYRFSTSVKNKYKLIDQDKINARQAEKARKRDVRDSISNAKFKAKERLLIRKDSLEREKVKDREFRILKKDSLEQAVKLEKVMKDSLERVQKQEKEQAKQLEKEAKKNKKKEEDTTVPPTEGNVVPAEEGTTTPTEESTVPTEENAAPKEEEKIEEKKEESVKEEDTKDKPEQQPEKQTEEQQNTNEGGES